MTKPHGTTPDGMAVDLIGQPLRPGRGSVEGVVIVEKGLSLMAKAEVTGTYTLNGNRFRIRQGDELPAGAKMDGAAAEPVAEPEERAKGKAPENRAKAEKAEKR